MTAFRFDAQMTDKPVYSGLYGRKDNAMNEDELIGKIEAAESELKEKRKALLKLQHAYLEMVGFTIEAAPDGFVGGYAYSRDDEFFLDADHAMEYAEDTRLAKIVKEHEGQADVSVNGKVERNPLVLTAGLAK